MPKKSFQLLVVAHPDDESIFFSGLVQKERKYPWKIIVLTDANADGQAERRQKELAAAARSLRASVDHWTYPDVFAERLPVNDIALRLRELGKPARIFTHGPLGEYGHPHHQDTCIAVHRAFPKQKIFSPAYNCKADILIPLSAAQYKKKTELFAKIYFEETKRFIQFIPAHSQEGFTRVETKEAEALYRFFTEGTPPQPQELKVFRWFAPYLQQFRETVVSRPF